MILKFCCVVQAWKHAETGKEQTILISMPGGEKKIITIASQPIFLSKKGWNKIVIAVQVYWILLSVFFFFSFFSEIVSPCPTRGTARLFLINMMLKKTRIVLSLPSWRCWSGSMGGHIPHPASPVTPIKICSLPLSSKFGRCGRCPWAGRYRWVKPWSWQWRCWWCWRWRYWHSRRSYWWPYWLWWRWSIAFSMPKTLPILHPLALPSMLCRSLEVSDDAGIMKVALLRCRRLGYCCHELLSHISVLIKVTSSSSQHQAAT